MGRVAQGVVGGGDCGAADAERLGQLTLGGQPDAQREPTVDEQAAHRVGERDVVGRVDDAGRTPLAQQSASWLPRSTLVIATIPPIGSVILHDWPSELAGVANLRNLPLSDRPVRRLITLYVGLVLYGASMSLMIAARPRARPVGRFPPGHEPSDRLELRLVVIGTGVVVLLLWIPLRQMPGIGTVSNVIVIGLAVDAVSAVLPVPHALAVRWAYAHRWHRAARDLVRPLHRSAARSRARGTV